jgi:murein L,D-transpeptidase YcbB/YkuD
VNSERSKTIYLDKPMRVSLYYWTVDVGKDGELPFFPDIYQRDRRVLRALNGPVRIRKPNRRGDD